MKPALVVIGSTNTDMVIKADHLPAPGETILGGDFLMNPGGKGANQAVAAKRLGGNVTFISKTGNDIFGRQSVQLFEEEGICTDYMISDPSHPSGIALIAIDKTGENCIVVASGANATLTPSNLKNAIKTISGAATILMQLEIPVETVDFVASMAKSYGIKVILNPAPALQLPETLLHNISIITPNRKEAEMLSGITITDAGSVRDAAAVIRKKGVETVIVTLGSEGAFISSAETEEMIAAPKVPTVDTTAAGDVFNGALAVALSENASMKDTVTFACHAAALAVTKLGAQSSAPYRKEVDAFMSLKKENKTNGTATKDFSKTPII
jgi:ribokinase